MYRQTGLYGGFRVHTSAKKAQNAILADVCTFAKGLGAVFVYIPGMYILPGLWTVTNR